MPAAFPAATPAAAHLIALHGFTGTPEDFTPLRTATPASWQWHCPVLPTTITAIHSLISASLASTAAAGSPPSAAGTSAPTILLGYSMGGRLALHYAATTATGTAGTATSTGGMDLAIRNSSFVISNSSALVLISASPGLATATERATRRASDSALAASILRTGTSAFLDVWWKKDLFAGLSKNLSPADYAALRARRLRNSPAALAATLRNLGTGTVPSVWNALPHLHLPVLCIVGEHDTKFRDIATRMLALLPNARLAIIPRTCHLPHLEAPAETAAALTAFVTSL
jgi:2-succinyl-6-hydroxy-2,4-cyclohexadiene-1-carboxylate synthase